MGMFSEIGADIESQKLKKVLEAAKVEGDAVISFCKTHIYPLYKSAIDEAWKPIDPEVKHYWEEVVK